MKLNTVLINKNVEGDMTYFTACTDGNFEIHHFIQAITPIVGVPKDLKYHSDSKKGSWVDIKVHSSDF